MGVLHLILHFRLKLLDIVPRTLGRTPSSDSRAAVHHPML